MFRGQNLNVADQTIIEPNFLLPHSLAFDGKNLAAKLARYEPANAEHPNGFRLLDIQQPKSLAGQRNVLLPAGDVVIAMPSEAPWLKANECFLASEIPFAVLANPTAWKQYASTAELVRGMSIRGMDTGNDVRVTVHSRLLQPFLDSLLVLLGLPLLLKGVNRNIFAAVGLCVGLVLLFTLVTMGSQLLGTSYLISPVLAAWLPLLIFVPWMVFQGEPLWE